ncbi:PDZ domain-containing protein [Ectobacillus antri]|uniref:PDZ domain-containing protein n=1 Tax=Ectobacillus antri TaxID=2486280 RepID=UPI000F59BB57|nr:PDZ domain-containing protein [Ectobacillus antri]
MEWLLEIGYAMGRFFLQPALYIFILINIFIGVLRVKKERREFSFKVHDIWYELRMSAFAGVGIGLLLSIATVGIGVVVSQDSLQVIAVLSAIGALLLPFGLLSAAYSIGVAIIVTGFSLYSNSDETSLAALAFLMSLLLFAEGHLIAKRAAYETTPRLQKGKRGLLVGSHESKRMWLVPLLVLVPSEGIGKLFSWWPVFTIGAETYSLFVIPFLLGFARRVIGSLPNIAITYTGHRVMGLSILVFVLALTSIWMPGIAIAAAGIAMLGRLMIAMQDRMHDQQQTPYFSVQKTGVMILDILPGSAAEELGLRPGEVITKVNGNYIEDVADFHRALRQKGAFCKLEVLDVQGEIRFAQRALYADDGDLGILFVRGDNREQAV